MFKNFLDKAKMAIEDIDLTLKPGTTPKGKKLIEFDASYFSFALEGGPIHTSLLTAIAKIKAGKASFLLILSFEGEKAGENVPLFCKWFISTPDGKMIEIEGLNGYAYQPCAEDVGSRISVQAVPVLDGFYSGMPVYGEVGPLVLDKRVEEKVIAFLNSPVCEYKVGIEKICFEIENKPATFPCLGIVSLNKKEKCIEIYSSNGEEKLEKLISCQHSDEYPVIEFVRQTTTLFELQIGPQQSLRLFTETSIDRDVLATALRMFGNEDLENHDGEVDDKEAKEVKRHRERTGSSNLEILMKRDKLVKQMKQLEKENQELKKSLETEKETKEKIENQVNMQTEKLKEYEEKVSKLQEELNNLKSEKENTFNEKLFLIQEVNIYKAQTIEFDATIRNLESQLIKSKESLEKNAGTFEIEDETIKGLKSKLIKLELDNDQLKKENFEFKKNISDLQNEIEQKDAQINSFKHKIQSLKQENLKLMSTAASKREEAEIPNSLFITPISIQPKMPSEKEFSSALPVYPLESPKSVKGASSIDSSRIQVYEDEINKLKQTVEKLNLTLETMKIAKENIQKTNKSITTSIFEPTPGDNPDNIEYLHKLVNTLTETIAENYLQLENQKIINKELGKRITELERMSHSEKSF